MIIISNLGSLFYSTDPMINYDRSAFIVQATGQMIMMISDLET
jgi:hypothetical protein